MKDDKKVPQLRFPEFTDAWKQRKFSDVFDEYSEKKHPELPALTIIQGKGTILREDSDRNLLYDKSNLSSYKVVRKDDFIVHLRSFEGGLEKANSDGIVSPAYHIFHGDNADTRFFYPFFRSRYFIDALLKPHVYGIRDGKSIDIAGMKTIRFLVPSFEEQKRIGKFVENLDNTITLQQRKLNSLQKLKKGLLQKMFPKNSENIPEIRFPEFSDAWKQRKLCEFVNFYSGLTYKPEDVNQSGTFVLRSSNVKNGEILDADNVYVNEDIAKSEKVQLGDIIVVVRNGSRDLIGKHATVKRSMPNTVIGAFMTGIRSKEYSFVNVLLDTNQFEKEINKNLGATINQITGYMFSNMAFTIPSEEEQHKIGAFFTQLDNTITLQQRKLESLQKLKKGLLQQMFI